MARISLLTALILWGLIGGALAQPGPEDTWLVVQVQSAAGGVPSSQPTISVFRVVGEARVAAGRSARATDPFTFVFTGLQPGPHEILLSFRNVGLLDGPRRFDLLSGPNYMEWRLPPVIPVTGEVTVDGARVVNARAIAAYLAPGKAGALPTTCPIAGGTYRLPDLFPGKYRLLLLTTRGYAFSEFAVGEDQRAGVDHPLALLPTSIAGVKVTDPQQGNLAGVSVTFSASIAPGFVVAFTVTTDKDGAATTQPLPPGEWQWTAGLRDYATAKGAITLKPGETQAAQISLAKR